ncbi:MAG: TonB-dependent receptor [Acidobacteria bacterium]|nr:TonB-dependent receptor [Acidobacteriota bacterium]
MTRGFAMILSLLFALSIVSTPARTQGESAIHGTVLAAADGSMLPGASVALQGAPLLEPLETTTGADGHFGFQRLVPSDYELAISHANFQTASYQLTLRPREVQNLTLQLTLSPLAEAIEVAAEASPIPTMHSPSSTVITAQTLDTLPLPERSNLADVIVTAAPGMIRGHDDFVHIRGSEIALNPFINGVSFWENAHSLFSPGLGADYIASMNVMTGGFSAEYGNRFGGVLDVVTKSGFTMNNNGSITLGLGTALRHNAGIEFGGHTERAAYYLNVGGFESARFLSPPDPRSIHNTGRGVRSFAQFDFAVNTRNFLKLVLMGDGTNFEIPKTAQDEELRPGFNNFQRTRSQSLILSWDHVYSDDMLQQSAFYQRWSRTRLLPNNDPYGAKADAERTLGTMGLKSDLTRFFGRHTVKGGMDLVLLRPNEDLSYLSQPWIDFTHLVGANHVHFRGPNRGPVVFQQEKTGGQISFYLQDKIQITRAFRADIGLRYDRYTLAVSDFHFSPRLNLAYQFSSGTVLHGSYNHFFVPPPIENILFNSAGLTQSVSEIGVPLPPLLPFKENQFELGVTHPIGRLLRVGLTGYYRISNDPAHTVLVPDSRIYAYANFDKGKAYGMEVRMEMPTIPAVGLSGYLNYALGRVYFWNPVTAGFTTEAEHITEVSRFHAPMDQTHTFTSGLTYRNRPTRLWASMAFEYGSGTPTGHGGPEHSHDAGEADHADSSPGSGPRRVPQHFTQNLSIGWDAFPNGEQPHLSLQFNIENLTNNVYVVAQESEFTPGQYYQPRLFSGSIKFHF